MLSDLLNTLTGNLGMGFEEIVLLITFLGSLLFLARDFRIGLIVLLVLFAAEYIVFSLTGWKNFTALIATVITLVAITLTIYISHSKKRGMVV